MNLKSIEYFLIVAEEMNVTRAAERLNISQQALSSHIKRLEDEYSVELFYRKPVFRLTPAGEKMIFFGRQILQSESSMRAAFSDITENARATLRLGISRLRSNVFFPMIWDRFAPSHPNSSIEIVNDNSQKLDELLQAGKIDVYIAVNVPESLNQHRIDLAEEYLQCCFTESLLKKYFPDNWQELLDSFSGGVDLLKIMQLPLITLRKGNRLREVLDQFLSHYISPRYVLECEQQNLIYEFAKKGYGVGLLSPVTLYLHAKEFHHGQQKAQSEENGGDRFYTFPVRNNIPPNITSLVFRSDLTAPLFLQDFIRDTQAVFRTYARTVTRSFSVNS